MEADAHDAFETATAQGADIHRTRLPRAQPPPSAKLLAVLCLPALNVYYWGATALYALLAVTTLASIPSFGRTVPVVQSTAQVATLPLVLLVILPPLLTYLSFATFALPWAIQSQMRCSSVAFHVHRAFALPTLFALVTCGGGTATAAETVLVACAALTIVYHGAVHDATSRCREGKWMVSRRAYRCVHQASVLVPLVGVGFALSGTDVPDALVAARVVVLTCEILVVCLVLSFVIAASPTPQAFAVVEMGTTIISFLEYAVAVILAAAVVPRTS